MNTVLFPVAIVIDVNVVLWLLADLTLKLTSVRTAFIIALICLIGTAVAWVLDEEIKIARIKKEEKKRKATSTIKLKGDYRR